MAPRTKKSTKSSTKNESSVAAVPEMPVATETPVAAETPARRANRKSTTSKAKKEKTTSRKSTGKAVTLPPPVEEVATETSTDTTRRRVHTPDTVREDFEAFLTDVENEIARRREKGEPVQYLRHVCKELKTLTRNTQRAMKTRRSTGVKRNNANSGFLKPVQVSKEMSAFAGWDASELHSRVDVTRALCDYVKENNLRDATPRKGKNIIPDKTLARILDPSFKEDPVPLTHARLQKYIRHHFPAPAKKSST